MLVEIVSNFLSGLIVTIGEIIPKAIYGREYINHRRQSNRPISSFTLLFTLYLVSIGSLIVSIVNFYDYFKILFAISLTYFLVFTIACILIALNIRKKSKAYQEVNEAKKLGLYKKEFYEYDALIATCTKCKQLHYLYHDVIENNCRKHYCYKCSSDLFHDMYDEKH